MQTAQGSVLESLYGVQRFIDEHAETLAVVAKTRAWPRMDVAITEVSSHATEHAANTSRLEAAPKGSECCGLCYVATTWPRSIESPARACARRRARTVHDAERQPHRGASRRACRWSRQGGRIIQQRIRVGTVADAHV
jgi:hypothetical protein